MKQRFSSIDVKIICQELSTSIIGLRVSNIYDLSSRIFLFKLAKPDHRKQLIIDSGFRCHLTEYSRTTASTPSGFVSRLRKCLKTRRVTSVQQLGTDRVIDIVFSDGLFHIYLEFFAGGNIILTDAENKILALFRTVAAAGEQDEVKIGLTYAVEKAQYYHGIPPLSEERLRTTIQKVADADQQSAGSAQKKSKKKVDVFRKAISSGFPEFPPLLLEDAFAATGFDSSVTLKQVLEDESTFQKAMNVLREAQKIIAGLSEGEKKGYIVAKERAKKEDQQVDSTSKENLLFEDFHPFRPRQFEGKPGYHILEYDSFNKTVDEYFSSIESQKLESRLAEHEETAKRKLETARADHQNRAGALKQAQELHIRKAEAIQANIYRVQEATDAVNGLIAQGMDWVEIARLIEMEQQRNNPVAQTIKLPLKLYENTITLLLSEENTEVEEEQEEFSESEPEVSEDSDSENEIEKDEGPKQKIAEPLAIDIDLSLSPWSNATQYYEQKRTAAVKEQKTIQSSEKALKSQEKKVTEDLKKHLKQEKQVLRPSRKPFWFEKYLYFISSEGYLVLGGRDSHQVEILYQRYLKKGDVFVHADLEGATPMIVKNKEGTPDAPIPPGTLTQAGSISVATSKAWETKALMPSWWVHAHQVSRTNERGELLANGAFMVKGEKNYLAPGQPILGFAVLFQISKESVQNHRKHRIEESAGPESTETVPSEETGVSTAQDDIPDVKEIVKEEVPDVPEDVVAQPETSAQVEEEDSSSDSEREAEDEKPKSNPLQSSIETEDRSVDTQAEPEDDAEANGEDNFKDEIDETSTINQDETPQLKPNVPPSKQTPATTKQKTARGKKAKAKKAAQKYAQQDEEDRELALRLLGANTKAIKAAESAAEAKAKREAELEAQKQRRRAQHERAAEAERKRQEQFLQKRREAAAEVDGEKEAYNDETVKQEAEDLSWLPALIGTPLPEDEVLAAIPVAAPWSVVARFKYRAKLQAGNIKKGKAIKEILSHWIIEAGGAPGAGTGASSAGNKIAKKVIADDVAEGLDRATAERMRAREADLLKGWRDVEVMNTLPVGKVRIVSSGVASGAGGGGGGGGSGKGDKGGGKGKGGGAQKGGKGGKKK
ncbi:hypothetical protein EYB25_000913 [Talaromyces marneffei]|uniref:uncharacterized protein n=1 Tax=Talaromyces marneffei TaxID=37727 RepID=UPI0012A93668|nr:uncharacterized protein EYB26_001418 [Talaromyces marneffei]KAE8556213.1 hypothetical protein EYB25_000913 [Talaromyces marneffei]QGA13767.1 hypothetical protein EYB26_001418 [Talaromyces marneffei]